MDSGLKIYCMNGREKTNAKNSYTPFSNVELAPLHKKLCQYIRMEEAAYNDTPLEPDTLMGHLERVAAYAVRLAVNEGVDPLRAELAALFHDAGKFHGGKYHEGNKPEEIRSIEVLKELAGENGQSREVVEDVSDAILQLYNDDCGKSPLSMVLFDADNLDKMGLLGIANYFIKSGLRGQGLTAEMITKLTVELTYARYAGRRFYTKTGRSLAVKKSLDTIRFIHDFLDVLREDCIYDTRIEHVQVSDVELELVMLSSCRCGAPIHLQKTWTEEGVKCTQIHLEMGCRVCENRYKIKFCRPMFVV